MKKLVIICGLLFGIVLIFNFSYANSSSAPKFNKYAEAITNKDNGEKLYDIEGVSPKNSFQDNMKAIFFPNSLGNGGALWGILKYAGMILVFIFIVYTAINLITSSGKPEKIKEALTSLLFVILGSFLFFGSMWIFTSVFNVTSLQGTSGVNENLTGNTGLLYFILSFLKGAAFFIAIIMIVITGFQLMNPQTGEGENGKKLAKNLINIIFALVGMKVVDFIYYIATQSNFADQAGDFIIQIARFLAYLAGSLMVIMLIYSGYLLIIDGGKGENFKKAKNTMINMVLAIIALFFFLFIIYQIFSEFGGKA